MKFAPLGLSCVAVLCATACTSAPSDSARVESASAETGAQPKPKGPAYLLRYVEYRSGTRLELVNPAHTTAVEQYSKPRSDPSRKVTSSEWMEALVEFLHDQGWDAEVRAGKAPTMARDSLAWALELTGPEGTSFVALPIGAKPDQKKRLLTLMAAFLDTYNATPGFQTVQAEPGKLPFKQPQYSRKPGQ
jgi:hypothetical protein